VISTCGSAPVKIPMTASCGRFGWSDVFGCIDISRYAIWAAFTHADEGRGRWTAIKPDPKPACAVEAVKTLIQLWTSDNGISVSKVAQYVTLQVVLLGFANLPPNKGGLILPIVAVLLSILWFFSIGRTFAYRDLWRRQISAIVSANPELADFDFIKEGHSIPRVWYAWLNSKFAQMGTTVIGGLCWLVFIAYRLGLCVPR
jgi:hypothetical protein